MKKIVVLLFALICLNSYAQERQMNYFNIKWEPTTEKRARFRREIIKQNDSLYIVTDYHRNGKVYMTGQYSSINPMIENGFFEFYDFFNDKKYASGYYTNGVMTGDWEITDKKGKIRKVNYDLKLMFIKNPIGCLPDSSPTIVVIDEMPKFLGYAGLNNFPDYVMQNIVYPPMAQKYCKEGKINVEFTINELGQICNVSATNQVYKDLEREAIRVISQSGDWTPGYLNGKAVKIQFTCPIAFVLR